MKKTLLYLLAFLPLSIMGQSRVSVHDPSIVWNPNDQTYYIFGSHRAAASTKNLIDWTAFTAPWATAASQNAANSAAFTTQQVTTITIGGTQRNMPNFNAISWAAKGSSGYNVDGNMWAPDVIWNPVMKKWCMYLSINGDKWFSSIILLTSDDIKGPYRYQAPVVMSGFHSGTDYKSTDLEMVLGTQATLPARYAKGNSWGSYWPNCIDPCVFYDEQGRLWMSYGSWSGGIFMLRLNEQNGLRDYDTTYPVEGEGTAATSDPYFGIKIAGGSYVSGEASYIRHIGDYYYLFITYGGLEAAGGYQMRVFRATNPDGPYLDAYHGNATAALYPQYRLNFGPGQTARGNNIFGAYGEWGYQTVGSYSERAQGHNSVLVKDGQSFLVYHTRFQNRGEGHEVRVHQLFVNQQGWLVAAPFEYSGETVSDNTIASSQTFNDSEIAGNYQLLIHRFGLDHQNKELATPVSVTLNADGTISGSAAGTWQTTPGTGYISITVGGKTYEGVVIEQTMEPTSEKTIAISALTRSSGETLWAHKTNGQTPTPTEETVGNTGNTTGYLGAYSTPLQLTDGYKATFHFTNYSTKAENYHNWVACVFSGSAINADNLIVALRADHWENVQWANTGISSNYDWTTFKNDMDGSSVVLTVKYQNGSVSIRADITTGGGKQLYEEFTKTGVTGNITTCLSVDHCHLVVSKAEVSSATGINQAKADTRSNATRYNLAGQQVGDGYRGIVIRNGRKYLQE